MTAKLSQLQTDLSEQPPVLVPVDAEIYARLKLAYEAHYGPLDREAMAQALEDYIERGMKEDFGCGL